MNNINFLFAGNTGDYSQDIARDFLDDGTISSAFILYYYMHGTPPEWKDFRIKDIRDPRITTLSMDIEYSFLYDKICDLNSLPALSKGLMEAMLPYESMCIQMARRRYGNFPVVEYEEGKRDYHKILRYWSYIFDKHNINMVYFETLPHMTTTYVIYGLARVKNIPIFVATDSIFMERKVYGYGSIEDNGTNIGTYYKERMISTDASNIELKGDIKKYYETFRGSNEIIKKDRKKSSYYKDMMKKQLDQYFRSYMGARGVLKPFRTKLQLYFAAIFIHRDLFWLKEKKYALGRIEKSSCYINFYKKHLAVTNRKYNKMAKLPDYNKKFIFFALQLTPEATVMPWAGVFGEQYTSIQLIARIAEKFGVYVYVKEHFVQPFRDKAVYELLTEIPNVVLIRTDISSFDLMEKCVAVATQTGTVILESALKGKPALVTSSGRNWKGIPNVFEISDEEKGEEIISSILKGFSFDESEVKKYFYAIQQRTMYFYRIESNKDVGNKKYRKSVENQKHLLKYFIKDSYGNEQ